MYKRFRVEEVRRYQIKGTPAQDVLLEPVPHYELDDVSREASQYNFNHDKLANCVLITADERESVFVPGETVMITIKKISPFQKGDKE